MHEVDIYGRRVTWLEVGWDVKGVSKAAQDTSPLLPLVLLGALI